MTRERGMSHGYFQKEIWKGLLLPQLPSIVQLCVYLLNLPKIIWTALIYTNLRLLYTSDFLLSASYNKKTLWKWLINIQECGPSGKATGEVLSVPNIYVNFNHIMGNSRNNDVTAGIHRLNCKSVWFTRTACCSVSVGSAFRSVSVGTENSKPKN